MYLGMIGTDYHVADLELRERVALAGPGLTRALQELAAVPEIAEVVILSTCNRTEVYLIPAPPAQASSATLDRAFEAVAAYLTRAADLPAGALSDVLVTRRGGTALHHLCEVAGGLQSMVLAEAQITAQVRHALQLAVDEGTAGTELTTFFSAALRCGKRVRTETALGRADTSLAHVAIDVMRRVQPDLSAARILLVGAGKINTVAASVLHATGAGRVTVTSRTLAAAQELAATVDAEARPLEDARALLADADIVLTAMRLSQPLITAELLRQARPAGGALLIVDLAVPRNVAPEVGLLPGVTLLDVDSLEGAQDVPPITRDLERARLIVDEAVENAVTWTRTREAVPVIAALRAHVDSSKDAELARTLAGLGHLAEQDREAVALMAHRLVNKMFHHLAVRMKKAAADPSMEGYLPVARYLFGVDEHPPAGPAPHEEGVASSSLAGSQG